MKFGGTSLGDGKRIRNAAEIVKKHVKGNEIVVVASAMAETTDDLIRITNMAERGNEDNVKKLLDRICEMHENAIGNAIMNDRISAEVWKHVQKDLEDLKKTVQGICFIREATPRTRDLVLSFGERLSTRILWGALLDLGIDAEYLTGKDAGIVTDSNFGEAMPLIETTKQQVSTKIGSLLKNGKVPVVTGFIAADIHGVITTLGRGGSDYTATLIANSIDADEVWLWSDVDGLMTSNPKIVPNAKVIQKLSYMEAIEMAMFGAKGLHPRALEPAMEKRIPVRIKNTFNPNAVGTLITDSADRPGNIVKAVLLVDNVAMINIKGSSMVGKPGTAAKILDAIAKRSVNIMMISQSVSESCISIIVRKDAVERMKPALETLLLSTGIVKDIEFEMDVAVISVIGEGMKGTPGIAAKIFNAVARKGINVKMIAQGGSELSISFVVKESDAIEAVKAIHEDFGLHL